MKVVFIITDYGGFNNFLGELATELTKGNEVHAICDSSKVINYKDKFPYEELGITFHYIPFSRNFGPLSKIKTSIKIKKILNSIKPDVVNLHFTSGIFVALLSGKIKFKTIGVFHGLGFPVITDPVKKFIFKQVEYFCFKRLDKICVINDFDYELLNQKFPGKVYKFKSYGVGCETSRFDITRFSDVKKESIRNQINVAPDDFVLMFTGRFVHFKGFHLVIKALKYIEDNKLIDNIKLILAGGVDAAHSTNLTNDEYQYFLDSKNVINIGFTSEVERYLAISNLFLLPSSKEGMPVCIMEAISMGVPVITLNSRGCNDLIENNFNGILLDIDADHIGLANSILRLYHDKAELALLSQNTIMQRPYLDRKFFIKDSIALLGCKVEEPARTPNQIKLVNNLDVSYKKVSQSAW
jgi:glycosyltransferase involved in cell wall biosynthesis